MQPKKTTTTATSIKKQSVPKNGVTVVKKQQIKPKQGFTQFPSAKLSSIKTADPFAEKKGNSFAHLYSSGAIPCKVDFAGINLKLKWNAEVNISQLSYNPLLVTCFDGLIEQKHPYGFIAFNASKDMIMDENSAQKLIELHTKLVWSLRTCLSSSNQQIADRGLEILRLLSDKVGSHLNSHVKNLVTPIKKHMGSKKLKEKAINTLRALEDNGGPEVGKIIKAAIPTYSNT